MKRLWFIPLLVLSVAGAGIYAPPKSPSLRYEGDGWTYYSAYFASNANLLRSSDFTGNADGKVGTLSVWVKIAPDSSDAATYRLLSSGSAPQLSVGRSSTSRRMFISAKDTGGADCISYNPNNVQGAGSNWTHCLYSWDLSVPKILFYVNGVSNATTPTLVNTNIDYTATSHAVGSSVASTVRWYGWVSELWLAHEFVDITQTTNRDKFYNALLHKPVNLGTDGSLPTSTAPLVYLRFNPAAVTVNAGTGGDFTEVGDVQDGGAEKP